MSRTWKFRFSLLLCAVLLLAAGAALAAKPVILVSVPPHAGLAERLTGSQYEIKVLIEAGQDPHTFEPTARQVMAMGQATLFFTAGLEFEQRLLQKISSISMQVVDLNRGIEPPAVSMQEHQDDDHDHEGPDPHFWLSPLLLKQQAATMARALAAQAPAHEALFQRNLALVEEELDHIHARLATVLAPYKGRTFYVFHPAFGSFGAAFGLHQEAVEVGGKSPSPRRLAELIARARAEKVEMIFVQPQFDRRGAENIASAIGGLVVEMDPLARDVMANFNDLAHKLEKGFQ